MGFYFDGNILKTKLILSTKIFVTLRQYLIEDE